MADQEIFLSWSKPASRTSAETFREYLPSMLSGVKPWMSSEDIAKGSSWFNAVSDQLARSRACIIFITPENLASSWLYYEAGAVGNAMKWKVIFPYLLGVRPGELGGTPLGQYQVTLFEKEDTRRLIFEINKTLEVPIPETVLGSAFDGVWSKLQRKLSKIPLTRPADPSPPAAPPAPPAPPPAPPLSPLAIQILIDATSGERHTTTVSKTMYGFNLGAGGKNIANNLMDDRREAELRGAVNELVKRGLIADKGTKGEVFGPTSDGYAAADEAKKNLPPELSDEAKRLVSEAAAGDGRILMLMTSAGFCLETNGRQVCERNDSRVQAAYRAAVKDLVSRNLLDPVGSKGEAFQLTHEGYKLADTLPKPSAPEFSDEARRILLAASAGKDGQVMGYQTFESFHLTAGGTQVCSSDDDRIVSGFKEALEDLVGRGYLRVEGEDNYQITKAGYAAADEIRKNSPTPTLSEEAKTILIKASIGKSGHIAIIKDKGFTIVGDHNEVIISADDARIEADYRAGMQELLAHTLVQPVGDKGEVFRATRQGHMLAADLAKSSSGHAAPSSPPITDDADILVHLQGWMQKNHSEGTHTSPITFADVDRELNLPPGSAVRLLERAALKLNWAPDTKGPSVVVFKKVGAPGSAPRVIRRS